MKKGSNHSLKNKYLIFSLFIIYVSLIVSFGRISYNIVSQDLKKQIGSKVTLLAADIASRTKIANDDFYRLKNMEYRDLFKDTFYTDFVNSSQELIKESEILQYAKIKYIFVQVPLSKDDIKYTVLKNEESFFQQKAGTSLDCFYLLDSEPWSIIRKDYSDRRRYDVRDAAFIHAYKNQKSSYHFVNNAWGNSITGYAPFYAQEGKYIGLVGVDLELQSYDSYRFNTLKIILLFCIFLVIIGISSVLLMFKVILAKDEITLEKLKSSMDGLTNILNRTGFMRKFANTWARCLEENKQLALLIVDIDYFKQYNDNYGHLEGDNIIVSIAKIIKETTTNSPGFVGRYGGDEFMILLENANDIDAQKMGEKILKSLNELNIVHKYSPKYDRVTVSIGISSIIPMQGYEKEHLIRLSDKALYQAKNLGKNRFCFQK